MYFYTSLECITISHTCSIDFAFHSILLKCLPHIASVICLTCIIEFCCHFLRIAVQFYFNALFADSFCNLERLSALRFRFQFRHYRNNCYHYCDCFCFVFIAIDQILITFLLVVSVSFNTVFYSCGTSNIQSIICLKKTTAIMMHWFSIKYTADLRFRKAKKQFCFVHKYFIKLSIYR